MTVQVAIFGEGGGGGGGGGGGDGGGGGNRLFAVVTENGVLARNRGAQSAQRQVNGVYIVTFTQNVNEAVLLATVGHNPTTDVAPAMIVVQGEPGALNAVRVRIFDNANAAANRPFFLQAFL